MKNVAKPLFYFLGCSPTTTIIALAVALVTFYDAKSQETDYRIALTSEFHVI